MLVQRHEALNTRLMYLEGIAEQYSDDPGGFGPRADAERAGNFAALQAVTRDMGEIREQQNTILELLNARPDAAIWERLSRADQQIAAKHNLLSGFGEKKIRSSEDEEKSKEARAKRQLPLAGAVSEELAVPADWKRLRDEVIECSVAFPTEPVKGSEPGIVTYTAQVDRTTYQVTRTNQPVEGLAGGEAAHVEMLATQADALVDAFNKAGVASATRRSELAGVPARDIFCFHRDENGAHLIVTRMAVVKGKMVAVQVLNAKADDVEDCNRINQFFASVNLGK
jgi:hypothetical protein